MEILKIHVADWAALGLYLLGITVLGVWSAKKVKDTADFFIGGRRFGKLMMIFFAFGAGTSGNQAVGVAAKSYTSGVSGIWYQWLWLFATPFYWIIAPAFRRMRAITTGDFYEFRYNGQTAVLYSIVGIVIHMINIGVMLLASGKLVQAISGEVIPSNIAIIVMTVLFLAYGMAGGLGAAIITDFIQGVLTILLSFLLLPFAFKKVGGWKGLHEQIGDKDMFSLVAPGEINTFFIVMFAINVLLGIVTQPHVMGVCAAGRKEIDGRVGFAAGNFLKRFCTIAWMLTGLCAVVLYTGQTDPDLVYGLMARDILPGIMPGLVGLFLAGLLASVMSSCDAFMVSSSGLFTQNVYRKYFVTDRDESHYVSVGRVASLVIVAGSLVFAFSIDDVPKGLKLFWKLTVIMAPAFWLGLYWRGGTAHGAWASAAATCFVMVYTTSETFQGWAVENLPDYMLYAKGDTLLFRESWQILFYLVAGFSTGILVSLFTRRPSVERLDRFYSCVHTPVDEHEPHSTEAFTLPPGIEPVTPKKLINHPDFEIPGPTRVGMAGFIIFWVLVIAMIQFVYWMTTWGT